MRSTPFLRLSIVCRTLLLCYCLGGCIGCPQATLTAPVYSYSVVESFPHDPAAFTQGLAFDDGVLYEGTGINGQSSVRVVELATGAVLSRADLDEDYFGEGIAIVDERIIQLTWRGRRAFIYDKVTLEEIGQFEYDTEGWGITYDGTRLIMSDGTNTLYVRDPDTFEEIGRIDVYDGTRPIIRLNELEFIDGLVYANVWLTDRIAVIDPETGDVTRWLDLAGLLPATDRTPSTDVLNGIAYDPAEDRLFVTGKRWPKLFHIDIVASE